jgi:hypothetical protein
MATRVIHVRKLDSDRNVDRWSQTFNRTSWRRSSASVVFGTIEPMHLLTAGKWRFVKTVKHSVWPASTILISALSSKVASGWAIAISRVSKLGRGVLPGMTCTCDSIGFVSGLIQASTYRLDERALIPRGTSRVIPVENTPACGATDGFTSSRIA